MKLLMEERRMGDEKEGEILRRHEKKNRKRKSEKEVTEIINKKR